MLHFRTLLKNKNFAIYSVGQAFSQFGDRLVQIALIGLVYKRWPGSTMQLAKLFFFTVIPSFFISPVAGVFIDRWKKKYVMVLSDSLRAVTILFVPVFFMHKENIVPIYVIIFLVFGFACFFLPARLSIIPNLVSKEEILIANSASSIIWVVSGIIGFSLGGVIAEWIGIKNSLYLNSILYGLSAASFLVLAYSMKDTEPKPGAKAHLELGEMLKEGLKILFFDGKIRFVTYVSFILSSIMGSLYVVGVVFIQETLHSMTKYIGLLSLSLFGGLLIGCYIYGKIGEKLHRVNTLFTSLILIGIFVDIFAIGLRMMKSFVFGSFSAFIIGFFIAPIYVVSNTIIHETIDSNLRGRIFSSIGIVMNMGFLLFMFISSILAEYIDRFWIIAISGMALTFFGILSLSAGFLRKLTFSS